MATASDLTLLLRAICENPADDTARLVFADAAQEAGADDRAEFIRVQCRIAASQNDGHGRDDILCPVIERQRNCTRPGGQMMPSCERCVDVFEWQSRDRELRGEHRQGEWPANIHKWFIVNLPGGLEVGISRGFISSLTATAEQFLSVADSLIWNPEQTIVRKLDYAERSNYACKVCGGVPDEDGMIEHGKGCYTQDENGGGTSWVELPEEYIPRPFPETAQPITEVTFTTDPNEYDWWRNGVRMEIDGVKGFLHDRWPGVRFHIRYLEPPVYGELFPLLRPHTLNRQVRVPDELMRDAALPAGIPQTGWHLERETHLAEFDGVGYRSPLSSAWSRQPDSFTLTVSFEYEYVTERPHAGAVLHNLIATDREGREYRVPTAILTRYEPHVIRPRYATSTDYVEITAIASSTPVPL